MRGRNEVARRIQEKSKMKVYDSTCSILRHNYETEQEYQEERRDAEKHYGFKARVTGGWKFFAYETDYKTWKNQK